MDVILLERVEKLGNIGDVVSVKPGFARNFLLPRNKALRANAANKARFEANRAQIEADNAERRAKAQTDSKKIDGAKLVLIRQASNAGALYGSVAARDLAEALTESVARVGRNQIVLDKPLKNLGLYKVKVALHPEVSVEVEVNIARSPEEAELQAKGIDIAADMFERDEAGFTEEYDPNAEPGATADAPEAATDEAA
jgi:large subunit ribosomal protein L9